MSCSMRAAVQPALQLLDLRLVDILFLVLASPSRLCDTLHLDLIDVLLTSFFRSFFWA